jgi:hypothetical protein
MIGAAQDCFLNGLVETIQIQFYKLTVLEPLLKCTHFYEKFLLQTLLTNGFRLTFYFLLKGLVYK